MKRFEDKKILIGVTGGIAAYKACDVIRQLQREGATVTLVMTPAAENFITPLTLESLTRQPVWRENLEIDAHGIPTHISLAQQSDAMLILPASANTISKLSHAMADNLLTTTALTMTGKPLVIAPAMNTRMWENPLVRQNIRRLSAVDHLTIIPPDSGELACGEIGEGKLAPIEDVVSYLYQAMHPQRNLFAKKSIIITAGAFSQPLDKVRTLTNRSSGKMGLALADELFAMGGSVLLIHSIPGLERPYTLKYCTTHQELSESVYKNFSAADGIFMAAAVPDFKLSDESELSPESKFKKGAGSLDLALIPTEDILTTLAENKASDQVVVGFAAETDHILQHAREKLERKHLDLIVANDVSRDDIGFGSDENEVTLLFRDKERVDIPQASKPWVARQILVQLFRKAFAQKEEAIIENVEP